jgi:hypothetical protein
MSKFLTVGVVTGVLGFAATVSSLFGFDALAGVLNDPATAATIQQAIGLALQLAAAFMGGVKPTA